MNMLNFQSNKGFSRSEVISFSFAADFLTEGFSSGS